MTSPEVLWRHLGDPNVFDVYAHDTHAEPGTWYPTAIDAARTAVIEAARAWRKDLSPRTDDRLCDALDHLAALTADTPDDCPSTNAVMRILGFPADGDAGEAP